MILHWQVRLTVFYTSYNFVLTKPHSAQLRLNTATLNKQNTSNIINAILRPLYRPICVSWHPQLTTEGFCGSKVLLPICPRSEHIRIKEKTLEFSLTVLAALSPYLTVSYNNVLLLVCYISMLIMKHKYTRYSMTKQGTIKTKFSECTTYTTKLMASQHRTVYSYQTEP